MSQLPDKRTSRIEDVAIGISPEDHTAGLDRETLEDGTPHVTNDSMVRDTGGGNKTEILANDYEKALPGHYRLIKMIGRGGMSEVFLAADERLGRNVAIKFLNSEFRRDPDRMRRFNQEARAASALNHPNILIIHDIGETEGVQYIVSEFVEGKTVASLIAAGKIPLSEAISIASQIASALVASHNAGIVHRDIKPENVMLRRDGSVKVLDFGLAKETGGVLFDSAGLEARTLAGVATSPGLILGTPQYMSPEQARGKELDGRSDIFSFGIVLFEMVTGRQPFPGNTMVDIITAVVGKEPMPLTDFIDGPPQSLVRIIDKSLRKNKEERYASAEHLLSDLKDLQREVADLPFDGRETKGSQVRSTNDNTRQSIFHKSPARRNLTLLMVLLVPVAASITWWISSRGVWQAAPTTVGSMRMVPITNWSASTGELVAAASFSPDSRMIAFAATKSGATEIWAKPVIGGDPIQVTRNGFYNQYPVWSPNNQEIAFFSSRNGSSGIWRASFAGGEQIQIASRVSPQARPVFWSKAKKIYFQDGSELFAVDENTGERSRLTAFESAGLKPRTIELSADEASIAYSIRENGLWKIYVKALNAETAKEIASSNEQIDQVAWDPDGKSVIYSNSVDGAYQVFRSGLGYNAPVQLSNGNLDFFVQDVSSDGSKILYGSVSETSDLWSIDISDGKQTTIASEVAAEFWPDVSPDGKNVIYQSVNQADRPYRGSIIIRSQSGDSAPIVASQEGFAPVWSPDGQWAAYFRRSDAGISIWRVRANGADAQKIADGQVSPPGYLATPYLKTGIAHISWSPDGSQIAYTASVEGHSNVWRAAADGPSKLAVSSNLETGEVVCCPVWMPDGKSIIYVSDLPKLTPEGQGRSRLVSAEISNSALRTIFDSTSRFRFLGIDGESKNAFVAERRDAKSLFAVSDLTDIYQISLQSGSKIKINSIENAYFHNIHLSRDGNTLAFVTRANDVTQIWKAPIKGGSPKQLAVENDPKILISSLAWSPDGKSIVFGK
ncbi:MAG: protein kinase domain-containing protein, partial [Pyrinomonadaceae bacterium]